MAGKEPFRVAAGNKIPIPWPYTARGGSPEAKPITDQLAEQLQAIVKEHGIEQNGEFLQQKSRLGYKTQDILVVSTPDEPSESWRSAATDIQELFDKALRKKHTNLKIGVEIENKGRRNWDISYLIKPNTVEHEACMAVQDTVCETVERVLPGLWTSISYHMRGPRDAPKPRTPTIMIAVLPGSRHMWGTIELQIEMAINTVASSTSANIDLAIELVASKPMLLFDDEAPAEEYDEKTLPSFPTNGSSIGPRGAIDAGTLGTWIYFQPANSTKKQKAFLTCYQVISPGDPENRNKNNIEGIALNGNPVHAKILVDYPAPYDFSATKKSLLKQIAKGNDPQGKRVELINFFEKRAFVGEVKYASGKERLNAKGQRMDWAVVVFNHENTPHNKPLQLTDIHTEDVKCSNYIQPTEGEVVTSIGTPRKGEYVWKIGRSSKVTVGDINSVATTCYWHDERKPRKTREHEIRQLPGGQPFVSLGDSGSMVFNVKKEWIGMIWGAEPSYDAGYFTTAQDIIDDIKKTTGGTVTLM